MIDFFGRKAKAELAYHKAMLEDAESRIRELADIIRENDQLIYNMAQKTSWPEQRPLFNQLQAGQESRMKAESNRIGAIMQKELIDVYAPRENHKSITQLGSGIKRTS